MRTPLSIPDPITPGESVDCQFDHLLNLDYGPIGRTVSTKSEPNTSRRFFFWVRSAGEGRPNLEIGNIVAALGDDSTDVAFATVVEMRSYSDVESFIADYLSHNFGQADVEPPTDVSEVVVVICDVMRNASLTTKPIGRSRVFFPSHLGIQFAYGLVDVKGVTVFSGAPIPIGLFENGDQTSATISVDENFLIGPEGAHLSVSGISGLASKTSAVQFILASLIAHTQKKVAFVLFNVKSKDLLYMDQPNPQLESDAWSKAAYQTLGISPSPFSSARFFGPFSDRDPGSTLSKRKLSTTSFSWDLQMLYRDIPQLFSPFDWDDKMEGVWYVVEEEIDRGNILTYSSMLTELQTWIDKAASKNDQWVRGQHIATWRKMFGHLKRFPRSYPGLIRTAGRGFDIPWGDLTAGGLFVIDIEPLNERGQRLVFGRAMRSLSDLREDNSSDLDAIVVFVDELNKFAPSGSERSPLKSRLVDITARGRSLGLVLFGAQQFASGVDKQIVDNSSTQLYGRTESNELRSSTYGAFTEEVKAKLTMLAQGHLLARAAKFPQPIFLRFPFPPCRAGDKFDEDGEILI